ncbi:hydrogenase maturation nickel metallochaperone HypA [Patescibacteria group bacterium]|nr:hydrogenase maturation nickel metallochaperone HypA [Patescibacteria group bacterium]MBU4141304.1 hydrogenase maturation nickel metallochaperone HypA [Patescibacteria group bacterium]MBU4338788.1 hydrogenase maturation nickel metallochaperone HypA [Patescibacteria group bacterium]MBU4580230.1 hydrogenase maturation nickel metallochaperone HypA [Patescibacteria group bacterium]
MHDLLAAKDIIDEVVENANKNNLKKISKVFIELGNKEYSHGNHSHIDIIEPENLEFNLKLAAKNTVAENAKFIIKKSDIPDILVKEIEGE